MTRTFVYSPLRRCRVDEMGVSVGGTSTSPGLVVWMVKLAGIAC